MSITHSVTRNGIDILQLINAIYFRRQTLYLIIVVGFMLFGVLNITSSMLCYQQENKVQIK